MMRIFLKVFLFITLYITVARSGLCIKGVVFRYSDLPFTPIMHISLNLKIYKPDSIDVYETGCRAEPSKTPAETFMGASIDLNLDNITAVTVSYTEEEFLDFNGTVIQNPFIYFNNSYVVLKDRSDPNKWVYMKRQWKLMDETMKLLPDIEYRLQEVPLDEPIDP